MLVGISQARHSMHLDNCVKHASDNSNESSDDFIKGGRTDRLVGSSYAVTLAAVKLLEGLTANPFAVASRVDYNLNIMNRNQNGSVSITKCFLSQASAKKIEAL